MQIHSITIENFRAIEKLSISDIPETGVIVIAGDNEQGKSSILEAIFLALTAAYKTTKREVKAIQPVDRDVATTISLQMTIGPVNFQVTKTYNKQRSAELVITAPQRANFTGDQAEAKLTEIISEHLDKNLLDTLFMKQGEVTAAVNAVGIPSLTQALNQRDHAGEEPGGDTPEAEDTALMAAVEAEYLRYFTRTGKESKSYAAFGEAVDAARNDHEDARAAVEVLSGYVEKVERVTHDREDAEAKLPAALAEVTEREIKVAAANQAKAEVEQVSERLERAEEDLRRARKTRDDRREIGERVARLSDELAVLRAEVPAAKEAAEQESQTIAELSARLEQLRNEQKTAGEQLLKARNQLGLLQDEQRRAELSRQVHELDDVEARIAQLRQQAADPVSEEAVSEEAVSRGQEAADEVKLHRSLSQKRTGGITFRAEEPREISVNDQSLELGEAEHTVELAEKTTIEIAGVTAVITPGEGVAASRRKLEEAETKLRDLLAEFDVDSVEQLRERRESHKHLQADLENLNREVELICRAADPAELRAEHDRLSARLAEVEPPADLTLTEATQQLQDAEHQVDELHTQAQLVDSELEPWRELNHGQALVLLQTRVEAAEQRVTDAEADLARVAVEASEVDLEAALAEATENRDRIVAEKLAAEKSLRDTDPELAEELLKGAEANARAYRETIDNARNTLAALGGRIEMAAGAEENLAKAEAALEAAQNRQDSQQRRAEAARRLHDLMVEHRDLARRRYAAPFSGKLNDLAGRVFGPGVEFTLDDQLTVTARSLGPRTVELDHLSGGAQEQLAILTRFAIADLVADSGVSAPVFIDDALGSTDPERLTRMATLFNDAGREGQVFVLTCVPERYHRISPKTLHDIDDLKSGVLF